MPLLAGAISYRDSATVRMSVIVVCASDLRTILKSNMVNVAISADIRITFTPIVLNL